MTAVRLAAVALTMVTGFWPGIALYILAAALMEAAAPQGEPSGEHVPDSPAERARLMRDMKERILRLDKRIQRMEDQVVRPDFQWDSRWGRERSTSAAWKKQDMARRFLGRNERGNALAGGMSLRVEKGFQRPVQRQPVMARADILCPPPYPCLPRARLLSPLSAPVGAA